MTPAIHACDAAETSIDLRCPACGNDGSLGPIRYVLAVCSSAEVVALRRGGVLELACAPVPTEVDTPARPGLECRAVFPDAYVCGHGWDLPVGISGIAWKVRT